MSEPTIEEGNAAGTTLGIEAGGTRTTVLLVNDRDEVVNRFACGPANLRLMTGTALEHHLRGIRKRLAALPDRIGIGMAGARSETDCAGLRQMVARVWPDVACAVSDDLETALYAIDWLPDCPVQVLLLSGTGSCILGRRTDPDGTIRRVKIGGRGHILGDRASACDIAQHALRAVMTIYDQNEALPELGGEILTHLQLNDPADLIEWSLEAKKSELAGVAVPVFRAAAERQDEIAVAVLQRAAERITKDGVTCASRLVADPNERIQFVFNGAVLLKNPAFAAEVSALLLTHFPNSIVTPVVRPSVWGAVELARQFAQLPHSTGFKEGGRSNGDRGAKGEPIEVASAPTERRHPRSMNFSKLSVAEGIALMLDEDRAVPQAILAETEAIEWTVKRIVAAFAAGGRLIYAGAGTSGRLGVLDASECPPTFRTPPDQVQGIIAGGRTALWAAVEGAEDDAASGRQAIINRSVVAEDVVIGISASGHAPFVWGCLKEAKKRGATTVLLTFNPAHRGDSLPDRVIAPDTGPELLTGSTRLKAGTGTKLILNILTTLAMTHSGKVMGNLMIDLNPSNHKLRGRAVRIVSDLTGSNKAAAEKALAQCAWDVRDACRSLGLVEENQDQSFT